MPVLPSVPAAARSPSWGVEPDQASNSWQSDSNGCSLPCAGMDPQLAAGETRKVQADLALEAARIAQWERGAQRAKPLTEPQVREAIGVARGLVGLLDRSDRADRTE